MKRFLRIILPVLVLLVLSLIFAGAAMADSPTTTHVTWDGSGSVGVNVDSGVSNAGFNTSGSHVIGAYEATDSNDNPYNYHVDSFSSYFNGSVTDGEISTGMARVLSYVGMYGNGGQTDSCYVGTDGSASLAFRSTTSYAGLVNASYGYQLPGGHNVVVADADSYNINRTIQDGHDNFGDFRASGSGDAILDCMSAEASGTGDLKLGRGAGCYTDANYNATGQGIVVVDAIGNTSVDLNGMGVHAGGGVLQFVANWFNSISVLDYSLTAH